MGSIDFRTKNNYYFSNTIKKKLRNQRDIFV